MTPNDTPGTSGRERTIDAVRVAFVGFATNLILVAVKITAGVVGNSYALVADGVESTLDLFSSVIVWRGVRVAGRAPDPEHPFGYGKAEPLAAALVALLLLVAAVGISIQAVREILAPHDVPAPFTLGVLIGVVVTKEALHRYARHAGEALGSRAVQADAWHHRADVLTSLAAFVGISVAIAGGAAWAPADDFAALFASILIFVNGVRLLRPSLLDLMDRAPGPELETRIREVAREVPGVLAVEKLMARSVGVGYRAVLHVQADPEMPLREAHDLGGRVRSAVRARVDGVVDVVIHMEPFEDER
ncbi:MAG: cation diffusion facilitator family transporter [Longimicrobiales bacterium]|nr:cation diffusion facilitator family transporter [Longimicrobiales bacterium]